MLFHTHQKTANSANCFLIIQILKKYLSEHFHDLKNIEIVIHNIHKKSFGFEPKLLKCKKQLRMERPNYSVETSDCPCKAAPKVCQAKVAHFTRTGYSLTPDKMVRRPR